MSLFLGKIHYWLFNKIEWFEGLEESLVKLAEQKGIDIEDLRNEIYAKYGAPVEDRPLEDMIDTSNIHGWLQGKISAAESRQAAWVTKLLERDSLLINDMIQVFSEQGKIAAGEYKTEKGLPQTPAEIYTAMNDYILEGMPCDRVNEVTANSEERIEWVATQCIHHQYWDRENGDVGLFYRLRDNWLKEFVKELNSNFEYKITDNGTRIIKLVG
ncbi:hypothetical protein [Clostridium fungisolvens]|uniref:Uncharacterized protein n=1 Tax=Clostridium fungisolvens TaxID=1604897 RepID=A0A6V8SJ13_9CLOT|nr:hypothetical protein [Clostridium fungisolvens]GFP74883.1 hypothetical protein bsdtw1_00946 [Clostridium fungisolvens]